MKRVKTFLSLIMSLALLASCNGQTNKNHPSNNGAMEDYEFSPENAHPKAKKLLNEEFYWSPIEETGPFGSDDGSDAAYGFVSWRQQNKKASPVVYLNELVANWGYTKFDYNELNDVKIKSYITSNQLGERTLIGQDNAIIAIGFGQFVLEGKIDNDIKNLTRTAIQREMSPVLIDMFATQYRPKRLEQLKKMLIAVDKMNG